MEGALWARGSVLRSWYSARMWYCVPIQAAVVLFLIGTTGGRNQTNFSRTKIIFTSTVVSLCIRARCSSLVGQWRFPPSFWQGKLILSLYHYLIGWIRRDNGQKLLCTYHFYSIVLHIGALSGVHVVDLSHKVARKPNKVRLHLLFLVIWLATGQWNNQEKEGGDKHL